MKANIEIPAGSKKHIVKIESSVWLPIGALLVVIALATIMILNGINFLSRKTAEAMPQISHVSYWCAGNKVAYPRTARIYPAIKNIAQINDTERDLEKETRCQIVSIYAWQNIDCPECSKDAEIKRMEKDLLMQGKEIQRLGKGGK